MIGGQRHHSRQNKIVYICLLTALLFEFAMHTSPMRAAELSAASSLLTQPRNDAAKVSPRVSVVRVDRTTGKLLRTQTAPVVHAQIAHWQDAPAPIQDLVDKTARAHGVDPVLVHSVIQVESGYNKHAVSPKGAEGLMQLMPGTARTLGVGNSFDPVQNIEAGVKYLKYLQDLYQDDRLALAAYNAGPKAVEKYKGTIPPYAETESYVEQVGARYRAGHEKLKNKAGLTSAPTAGSKEDTIEEEADRHPKLEQFTDDQGRLYLKTTRE